MSAIELFYLFGAITDYSINSITIDTVSKKIAFHFYSLQSGTFQRQFNFDETKIKITGTNEITDEVNCYFKKKREYFTIGYNKDQFSAEDMKALKEVLLSVTSAL
ncbi:MAG: hypothetical protein JST86_02720 [Bacteroidetes bacterium]|nr:hypothetical protein [Bacteroidota bacterium]